MIITQPIRVFLWQTSMIAIYFPIYFYIGVKVAFLFSGIFVMLDMRAWPIAFKTHIEDEKFIFLVITILTSFLGLIFFFANLYEILGTVSIACTDGFIVGLGDHVYFSVVTFTTLGYGEYTPQGYAKVATSIQAIMGLGYFAFIIGVCSSIFYGKIQRIIIREK